jgi:peptidyl-prolyl cis-trans isomerase C
VGDLPWPDAGARTVERGAFCQAGRGQTTVNVQYKKFGETKMTLREVRLALALVATMIGCAACNPKAPAVDSMPAADRLATVNGIAIPKATLNLIMDQRKATGQPDTDAVRTAMREKLIMSQILTQEAMKKGLANESGVAAQLEELRNKKLDGVQLELSREQILGRAYINDFAQSHKPTDAEINAEYDSVAAALGDTEYRVSHILVDTPKEAQDVLAKLKQGKKFEDLARAVSIDARSKMNGGQLDWAAPRGFVPPFADAVLKLTKGKYTLEPVQTQFGYHIIRLDDVRTIVLPTRAEVRDTLVKRLQNRAMDENYKALRASAKVE